MSDASLPRPFPLPPQSYILTTPGEKLTHCQIGGINGMSTSETQMQSHVNYISQFAPGRSLNWVYNSTHGAVGDLVEIFSMNYGGYSPNTASLMKKKWIDFHLANLDRPDAKYFHLCHSQGAIHTCNALESCPEAIRNRVEVLAIAPAKIVPNELCFRSFNYASKRDIVPSGEAFYEVATKGLLGVILTSDTDHYNELILLDPHPEAKLTDHDFQSPTFAPLLEKHIKEYLTKNGECK
jgi:hypothetical protein